MSTIKSSHITKAQNFTFQNLQPINYLKTFNKMLDHISKPSVQLLDSSKQLKTVKLSKFPLHPYYEQMQGILEGGAKKHNQNQKLSKKDTELQKLQEKFLNKHYTFVKGALQKIIQDNQTQQNLLVKSKNFYQTNEIKRNGTQYEAQIVKMVRLRSQPKLRSIKNTIDSARKTLKENTSKVSNYSSVDIFKETHRAKKHSKHDSDQSARNSRKPNLKSNLTHENTKTEYSSVTKDQVRGNFKSINQNQPVNNEEEHNPIFKKLKPPQKIERFRKRDNEEVDFILTARKTLFDPKQKPSIDSIYPMTDRTHNNQSKAESKKSSQVKKSIKRNEADQTLNSSFKLKDNLIEQNFEDDEEEGEKSIQNDAVQTFRKELKIKKPKIKRNDSHENQSLQEGDDADDRFFRDVEFLQNQQTKKQQDYASLVEEKVKEVKLKLNQKIMQVKRFDYSAPKQSPKTHKNKKESSLHNL